MVYLESVRYNRRPSLRTVVAGQRVPMELTSLGLAWLAVAPPERREALQDLFRSRRSAPAWQRLARSISRARRDVESRGCCAASWQPGVFAVAAPLVVAGQPVHALNMSVSGAGELDEVARRLQEPLLELARRIEAAVDRESRRLGS